MNAELQLLETLKELPAFKSLPEDTLAKLSNGLKWLYLTPGETLLTQGQLNTHLYFLVSGQLQAFVDGGLVAELQQKGDIVGEMSVISEAPCAATITAKGPVQLLRIDAEQLKRAYGDNHEALKETIYQIYALVLAEKLRTTNEKAKRFENLHRELQAAQAELEKINQNKMEELYSSRDDTMKRVDSLYKNNLLPLSKTLSSLSLKEGVDQSLVQEAQTELTQVLSLLEPLSHRYESEKALKNKKVLLVEPNKKQQITAKMALGGTGVELELANNTKEAEEKLEEAGIDLVFVGVEDIEWALRSMANLEAEFVLMTSQPVPEWVGAFQSQRQLPHIVSRYEEDRSFTIKNIMTTVTKLTTRDIWGLEKYMSWGVEVLAKDVIFSDQRQQLIEVVSGHFKSLGIRRSQLDRCAAVLEELLMNAIYDAPQDSEGNPLFNHLSRQDTVRLKPEQSAQLRYATDGVLFAVSVTDPFGGLTGEILLRYLESCYGGRAGELNKEKGGAGRGLHQIVENSDLVVFNVQPRRRTEVISFFHVDPKSAGMKEPSFHFFSL